MWSIGVHGGAGNIPDEREMVHRAGCARAADAGAAVLEDGGHALDAVCAAVRVLEEDPAYNAGHGAALDRRGLPVLDAAVMRGADLAYGAVAAVLGVRHPVDAARAVLDDGRHCLLAGASAADFAKARGVEMVSPEHHRTAETVRAFEARRKRLEAGDEGSADAEWDPSEGAAPVDSGMGNTVGAVARDVHGGLAAATSTGGLLMRYPGRVGDSPIAGAGTYASELGAISATGHGETMLRTVFAYRALESVARSEGPGAGALRSALDEAKARVGGTGGAILVRPSGEMVFAMNTPHMGVAWRRAGQEVGSSF